MSHAKSTSTTLRGCLTSWMRPETRISNVWSTHLPSSVYGKRDISPTTKIILRRPFPPTVPRSSRPNSMPECTTRRTGSRLSRSATLRIQSPNMAITNFVSRCLHGEPLVVYGSGEQTRDFTYIEGVVDANRRHLTDDRPTVR